MASEKQIEANRRNARQSTGPKSQAGKDRMRLNALKHGLTAATVVLPGEDPAALEARVEAWKDDLRPAGALENYLVERAAHVSWQLDRADRTIAARIADRMRRLADDRVRWEADDVARLAFALFHDPQGPLALYPHSHPSTGPRISWTAEPENPLDPAAILLRLEGTATGCRWLLDRWAELRRILDDGRKWLPSDRFRAVRLLGKQPLDALDDERLMSIYLACRAMDPTGPSAFGDLENEMSSLEVQVFERRAEARGAKARTPANPSAGRAALVALIDQAVTRLEVRLAGHQEREAAERAALPDVLAFDESMDAELLRRYQLGCGRMLFRAVTTFFKVRKESARDPRGRATDPEAQESSGAWAAVEPIDDVLDETKPISGGDPPPALLPAGDLDAVDETKPISGGDPPPALLPAGGLDAVDETKPTLEETPPAEEPADHPQQETSELVAQERVTEGESESRDPVASRPARGYRETSRDEATPIAGSGPAGAGGEDRNPRFRPAGSGW